MPITILDCVCGSGKKIPWATVNDIDIVECVTCGVRRVDKLDKEVYTSQYTSGYYHTTGSDDLPHAAAGREPHKTRFDSDHEVGLLRVAKLHKYKPGHIGIGTKPVLLDVGCANGAFMKAARGFGYEPFGIDLAKDDALTSEFKDRVTVGDIRTAGFQRRAADVITFNDCLEHFIDPISAIKAANGILKRDGILVIDIPDMGCDIAAKEGANFKHVKPHEHLWYFTANQLRKFLEDNEFTVLGMDVPVAGKVTAYASPNATVTDIEIQGPPGVGDVLWTLQKLPDIAAKESPCRLKFIVCCDGDQKMVDRARDFVLLSPYVHSFETRCVPLPRDIGCADPAVPVYELFPNRYLEPEVPPFVGGMIENWRPELPDDWSEPFVIPSCALSQARIRLHNAQKHVCIYMSSHVWNNVVAQPLWTPRHWAELLIKIADADLKPVILGNGWDADYARDVADEIVNLGRNPAKVWINTISRTTLPLAMAYMHLAVATIGIANGLPMLPLYTNGRSIIFWPERDVTPDTVKVRWSKEFQVGWLAPKHRDSGRYTPLVIGTFTVGDVYDTVIAAEKAKYAEMPVREDALTVVGTPAQKGDNA